MFLEDKLSWCTIGGSFFAVFPGFHFLNFIFLDSMTMFKNCAISSEKFRIIVMLFLFKFSCCSQLIRSSASPLHIFLLTKPRHLSSYFTRAIFLALYPWKLRGFKLLKKWANQYRSQLLHNATFIGEWQYYFIRYLCL